jgi:hypothetical protein
MPTKADSMLSLTDKSDFPGRSKSCDKRPQRGNNTKDSDFQRAEEIGHGGCEMTCRIKAREAKC